MGQAAALGLSDNADASTEPIEARVPARRVDAALVKELVDEHYRFIWRLLGRLGVPEADLDDATQEVFTVLTQRGDRQIKTGSERAFLFGVALKVAKSQRRRMARRREAPVESAEIADLSVSPELLADQRQARKILDRILEEMPTDMRVVFILFELDQFTTREIAKLTELAPGTVASRLRRARDWFQRRVAMLEARERRPKGGS